MKEYISFAGGYLTNPTATAACQFCSVRTTDQFLGNAFSIFYQHHWRDMGIVAAFFVYNVSYIHPPLFFLLLYQPTNTFGACRFSLFLF